MQRCRTALWAGSARSMLVRTILLICTGWILNLAGGVEGAPLIEHGKGEGGKGNNRIDGQHVSDVHSLNTLTDNHNQLNTYPDRDNNKTKTDNVGGSSPVILLPDNVLHGLQQYEKNDNKNGTEDWEEDLIVASHENETNSKKPVIVVIEYQPELVIRCGATGVPKPNVSWELEDRRLPHYVASSGLTHGYGYYGHGHSNDSEVETWVDLKLPKLNNAFYGKLRCRAENAYGNTTWEVELIHNANSSTFMKIVRCVLAGVFLLVSILVVRGFMWVDQKRQDKLYEKLPPQDFEIIKKFKSGLAPPPPSPCPSAIITHDIHIGNHSVLLSTGVGVTSCMKSVEITVEENGTESREGYKPVIRGSSTPDFQHRLINRSAGTSTPSTCSARSQILNAVNSWTNYEPYDDKLETSSQHFNVDFSKIIENGSFGIMYAGMMRNDLTMEWSTVAVKTGKTERDENLMLESILTELKILASLPKSHEFIRNLKGAYTKLLHKRQAFVFLDFCENGTLANFIDLNRKFFRDIFKNSNIEVTDRLPEQATSSANITQAHLSNDTDNDAITFSAKNDGVVINTPGKDDKIATEYPITFKDLLTWSSQIADGMNFLHKNRVIHGNLSTANIYLTSKFKIKIGNIGYTPVMDDILATEEGASKWLSVPHYEPFSKISDIWEYGRVLWEIFSLREQQCPDNGRIANFIQNGHEDDDDDEEDDGLEIPQFATHEIFELMLCCWSDNATLCPEFDVFVKSFKKMCKEVVQLTGGKSDKSQTG